MPELDTKRKSVPRFFIRAVQNIKKSEEAGHPMFDDVEYIEVRHPGEMHMIPCCRVKESHKLFYAKEYEAFKRGEEVPLEGFPITEWAPITKATAENLKHMGVHTVENLANMTETAAQRLGGNIQRLRIKAAAFLESHNSEQAQIDELKEKNKTLLERLEKLEALSEDTVEESSNVTKKTRNSDSGKRKSIKEKA